MDKAGVLLSVAGLNVDEQIQWMFDLGYQLSVHARGSYPLNGASGDLNQMLGFNELQHQIYGRIRHLRRGEEWTLESFLDGLFERAVQYAIDRELRMALNTARSLNLISATLQ